MQPQNLFRDIPSVPAHELVTCLHETASVRIERIVSCGHASPAGFWYDQEEHEWVVVLQGNAILEFEDELEPVRLQAGDCLHIPAHRRHRVAATDPAQITLWLAVFYRE